MATMMGTLDDSPAISVPRRLNYFPPISSQATMFKRRKKPSARELYHLSPQNHDFILRNPPVTPWDDPPEFFRTFIETPDDAKHGGKSTWPFLRQIGPKCAFKGMRKKTKDDEDAFDIYSVPNTRNSFRERFLEPECVGIAREYESHRLQFFSPRYADLRKVNPERYASSAQFTDAAASHRHSSSTRKVKAPPPSETRSTKSNESPRDNEMDQYHISSPFGNGKQSLGQSYPQRPIRVNDPKVSFEAFKKKQRGVADGGRVVRFEDSPLPEKLQYSNIPNPELLESAQMSKLTWHDIVQAPVVGTLISVKGNDSTKRVSNVGPNRVEAVNPTVNESGFVPWRLPKSKRRIVAPVDPLVDHEKRVGVKVSERDITTWIDNVRRAQPCSVDMM